MKMMKWTSGRAILLALALCVAWVAPIQSARSATIPISDVRLVPVQQLAFFWMVPPKTSAQFEVLVNGNWEVIGPIENKTGRVQGFGMTLDASIGQVPRLVIISGGVSTTGALLLKPSKARYLVGGERQAEMAMRRDKALPAGKRPLSLPIIALAE